MVFGLGLACAFAMAPAFWWPVFLLCQSAFYIFYAGTKTAKGAAAFGFFYALGFHLHGLFWVGNALLVEGNEFAWVWPLSVIGLPVLLSFFSAAFTGLSRRLTNPLYLSGVLLFTALTALCEWARGTLFTGFPWNLAGYTWGDMLPVLQITNLVGIYGLSLFTLLWFTLPGWIFVSPGSKRTKLIPAVILVLSFCAVYVYGAARLHLNPPQHDQNTSIRVVQPNILQEYKWNPALVGQHFAEMINLSQPYKNAARDEEHQTYIIWPETAIPPILLDNAQAGAAIHDTLSAFPHEAYLITGALRREGTAEEKPRYFNSIIVLNAHQEGIALYDKTKLVPFGEFIPFQSLIPIRPVVQFNGFTRGDGAVTLPLGQGFSIAPMVCYEVIFPGMARGGEQRPTLLVSVTNDAWYGDSAGPQQHFIQSTVRAIEQGVPMARSANTGISGIVDAYGRILARAEFHSRTALTAPLPLSTPSPTLYRFTGDWFFFLFIVLMSAASFYIRRL